MNTRVVRFVLTSLALMALALSMTNPLLGDAQAASTTLRMSATSSVVGGKQVSITVQISRKAPTGGAKVTLKSSNSSLLPVPSSVTIPAGKIVASLKVTAAGTTSNTPVTLTATYSGSTATKVVTVKSTGLQTFSAPSSIKGGQTVTVKVSLSAAAPAGGAKVTLTSSNATAFPLPASITIPAGSTSASTSVIAGAPTANTSITLTATWSGKTISRKATIGKYVPPKTPTPTKTATPVKTATPMPTATNTAIPTATFTATVPAPTSTFTATVPAPTATFTATVPAPTATFTATVPAPTATAVPSKAYLTVKLTSGSTQMAVGSSVTFNVCYVGTPTQWETIIFNISDTQVAWTLDKWSYNVQPGWKGSELCTTVTMTDSKPGTVQLVVSSQSGNLATVASDKITFK